MNHTLNDILESVVVIPYDENTISLIDDASHTYEQNDKFEAMDEMIDCFLNGSVTSSFAEHINNALANNESITKLPNYILQHVALYRACVIIDDAENDLERSVLSSILMNYLILYKSNFKNVPLPNVLQSFYQYHISYHLYKIDKVKVGLYSNIIEKVANTNFTENDIESSDVEDLRMMAKESFLYRSELLFKKISIQQQSDPFVQIFIALKNFTQKSDYLFYNLPLVDLLSLIRNEYAIENKKRKLSGIINALKPHYNNDDLYTYSSILLRLLSGEAVIGSTPLLDKQFSVDEFASYLYYEFLIEGIIQKITE